MEAPDLTHIVDTFVPITKDYFEHLRRDVIPYIRDLQEKHKLRWYSFLIHEASQLAGRANESGSFIHLRFEPMPGVDVEDFITQLPSHFKNPISVVLANMDEVDQAVLKDQDWSYAWKMLGECSEWVVTLLETYGENPVPTLNIIKFMHFITNALGMGRQFHFYMGNLDIKF